MTSDASIHQAALLCPSAQAGPGAYLFAARAGDQPNEFLSHPLEVTERSSASEPGAVAPETRFRFASPCLRAGCQQWRGNQCGVITAALPLLLPHVPETRPSLPECAIRDACRWIRQAGESACLVCPLIATDLRPTASFTSTPSNSFHE